MLKKISWFLIVAAILFCFVYYLLGAVITYSEGDRVGYIYKFSKRGYIFKTHEGTLKTGFINLGGGSIPNEEWHFSVKEEAIANEISNLDERVPVKLYYKQYYVRIFFLGDTDYFVYKIQKMPE